MISAGLGSCHNARLKTVCLTEGEFHFYCVSLKYKWTSKAFLYLKTSWELLRNTLVKLSEMRCKTHLRKRENHNPMNVLPTNQPKKLQPQRGNISGITWNIAGTELLDYRRGYFSWVTAFQSYFSLNTAKQQLSITPVASRYNIPCCLSSSSTTSTGFNLLAVHSPLATGFAALRQAVNVTRICQMQSRADHGALSKRCTHFFTKKKKNLFPEDL